MAEIDAISCEVQRSRWNWLGHVLRSKGVNDYFTALRYTPESRRARGRPKTTVAKAAAPDGAEGAVGRTMWWSYVPTGATSDDGDDDGQRQA